MKKSWFTNRWSKKHGEGEEKIIVYCYFNKDILVFMEADIFKQAFLRVMYRKMYKGDASQS